MLRLNIVAMELLWITLVICLMGANGDAADAYRDPGQAPTTGYACEGSHLNIQCGPGRKIQILRANYGRFKLSICNDRDIAEGWNLQCMSTRSLNIVNQMCSGKRYCVIHSSNRAFGDPCNFTPKYLEVQYNCALDYTPSKLMPTTTARYSSTKITPRIETTVADAPIPTIPVVSTEARETVTTTTEAYAAPPTPPPKTTPESTTVAEATTTITTMAKSTYQTTPSTFMTPKPTERPSPIVDYRYCDNAIARNISWPRTLAGKEVKKECPNNLQLRAAVWSCGSDPVQWMGKPDLSGCISRESQQLESKIQVAKAQMSAEIVEEIASDLVRLSAKNDTYGGDLTNMAKVMEELVQQVDVQVNQNVSTTPSLVKNVQKALIDASSNLLDKNAEETWKDLPQADQAKTATRVLSAVEDSAFQVAKLHTKPTVHIDITVNIMLEVNVVATDNAEDLVFPKRENLKGKWKDGPGSEIKLSSKAIKDLGVDGLARVIFLTYNNLEEFLMPQADGPYNDMHMVETEVHSVQPMEDSDGVYQEAKGGETVYHPKGKPLDKNDYPVSDGGSPGNDVEHEEDDKKSKESEENEEKVEKKVNSQIISASINERIDGKTQPLSEPIYYTLEHKTSDNVFNPSCSFWEYSEKTMSGKWSQFGCSISETNLTHTTCKCNHLTNFAILMDVQGTVLHSHHQFALSFITYIGCLISICCLFLAFCTFQFFKNLQCDRNTIHKNLCLSLFLAEVIFLAGIAQYELKILCSIVAGLLHYFFLASFAWMCMEGVQLYVMLIEVFEAERSRVKWYYMAAYGMPAIVVGISAAIDYTGYGTDTHCWLKVDTGFIWAFVGPVVAVITVNIAMLSIAIYMMCKHASNAAAWKMRKRTRMDNVNQEVSFEGNTISELNKRPEDNKDASYNTENVSKSMTTSQMSNHSISTEASSIESSEIDALSWLKGATVLVVLLGLTWTFGLLFINEQSVAMAYIFTILNCLQGLFIFIFHCVMNEKVQKEYKRACRRATWLPECIRVKYGGAKPYTSSTPNQSSTSGGNYFTRLLSGRRRKRSSTTSLPKSSSGVSGSIVKKDRLSNGVCRESQLTNPSSPHDSAIYSEPTEDPNGYLEPVSLKHDSVFDEGNFDLSAIEGSVVDSDFLSEYCRNGMPINVEKYKIQQTPPSDRGKTSRPESFYDDPDMKKLREKERLLSEYDNSSFPNLESDTDDGFDSLPKKRLSDGDLSRASLPLNNLNRESSSNEDNREECIYAEIDEGPELTPGNIQAKSGTIKRDNLNHADSTPGASQDVAVGKLRKALSSNNDGQILLYNGRPAESRVSADTQSAMDAHRMRLTSSDC